MPAPHILCLLAALLAAAEAQGTAEAKENAGYSFSCVSSATPRNISLFFGNGVFVKIQSRTCSTNSCNTQFSPGRSSTPSRREAGARSALPRVGAAVPARRPCSARAVPASAFPSAGRSRKDNITIPFAASGCATPNACELKKGEILNSGVFTYRITQTECYTPSGAQRMLGPVVLGSILPSLAGLLAVKFLS
ncbi:unnamed protein product [Eretmochelys imbricata]